MSGATEGRCEVEEGIEGTCKFVTYSDCPEERHGIQERDEENCGGVESKIS